jgi:uncharacterized peroxidase-related enzyme
MSRIQPIDPAGAPEPARSILEAVHSSLGVTPNLFKIAAQSGAAVDALTGLVGALSKGALDARSRESIALAVAEANACDYCLSAHNLLGAGAGLTPAEIADAREAHSADPKLNAILAFARKLVINRGHATDSDLEQLRRAGATDGEIVEAVANTALNIFTNYLNHVAATDIDFPVVRAGQPAAA